MTEPESITRMGVGIAASFAEENWPKALRYIERLKGILLDATVRDDAPAIRAVAHALYDGEQRLRIRALDTPKLDANAVMWQLRADVGTAGLASRIRPQVPSLLPHEEAADIPGQILQILKNSNQPMTNSELIARTGKDPAVVTRSLRILERRGEVTYWRRGGKRINAPSPSAEITRSDRLNSTFNIMTRSETARRRRNLNTSHSKTIHLVANVDMNRSAKEKSLQSPGAQGQAI